MITVAPLNRVVYEGATNTTMACESRSPYTRWRFWVLFPFSKTGLPVSSYHEYQVTLTTYDELDPHFNESLAIDQSQGTDAYSLVVFNATIYPSDRANFSTAGLYWCSDYDSAYIAHLVVIRKYLLLCYNDLG